MIRRQKKTFCGALNASFTQKFDEIDLSDEQLSSKIAIKKCFFVTIILYQAVAWNSKIVHKSFRSYFMFVFSLFPFKLAPPYFMPFPVIIINFPVMLLTAFQIQNSSMWEIYVQTQYKFVYENEKIEENGKNISLHSDLTT